MRNKIKHVSKPQIIATKLISIVDNSLSKFVNFFGEEIFLAHDVFDIAAVSSRDH